MSKQWTSGFLQSKAVDLCSLGSGDRRKRQRQRQKSHLLKVEHSTETNIRTHF